eukprot:m.89773 g.89773  ORF g.89773 m.89773 type:complete len:159 (-) comp14592_c0_seq1:524-1000(-)
MCSFTVDFSFLVPVLLLFLLFVCVSLSLCPCLFLHFSFPRTSVAWVTVPTRFRGSSVRKSNSGARHRLLAWQHVFHFYGNVLSSNKADELKCSLILLFFFFFFFFSLLFVISYEIQFNSVFIDIIVLFSNNISTSDPHRAQDDGGRSFPGQWCRYVLC